MKMVCYLHFPKGDMPRHAGPHGQASGLVGRQEKKYRQEPLLWFPWDGACEFGSTRLQWASLNNICSLWGVGTVFSCLVPGPGIIKVGGLLVWSVRAQ